MIALVLGGARSGKSEVAERLAGSATPTVTYVATGGDRPDDPEWTARIAAHRARRPPSWSTVEVGPGQELASVLAGLPGTVLVDSVGTWLAGQDGRGVDTDALCLAVTGRQGDTVLVSDEVGLGVHPVSAAGRQFRDAVGDLNRRLAGLADRVLLVVAGRVVELGRWAG